MTSHLGAESSWSFESRGGRSVQKQHQCLQAECSKVIGRRIRRRHALSKDANEEILSLSERWIEWDCEQHQSIAELCNNLRFFFPSIRLFFLFVIWLSRLKLHFWFILIMQLRNLNDCPFLWCNQSVFFFQKQVNHVFFLGFYRISIARSLCYLSRCQCPQRFERYWLVFQFHTQFRMDLIAVELRHWQQARIKINPIDTLIIINDKHSKSVKNTWKL